MKSRIRLLGALVACLGLGMALQPRPASAAYFQWLKISAGVGAWLQGAVAASSTQLTMGRYTPTDASTTKWWQHAGSFANSGGRRNQVMRWGWNCGPGGGRDTSGALNGALCEEFEQYYETLGNNKVMERHLSFVAPNDALTRYISFMGNLESPYNTSLYVYSTALSLGSGANSNDPASILIDATTTTLRTPGGYPRIILDDTSADTVTIANGSGGDSSKAQVILQASGNVDILSKANGTIRNATNNAFTWDTSSAKVLDPGASPVTQMVVDGNGVYFFTGGLSGYSVLMQSAATSFVKPLRANTDKDTTSSVGIDGKRFSSGMFAADSNPVVCSSSTAGAQTTVIGGNGVADVFRVCMKNAGGTYAWRDVYSP